MAESPLAAHVSSPAELKARNEAARRGQPFLVLRTPDAGQLIVSLADRTNLTIGRRAETDLPLPWDLKVSRLHLELQRLGGDWIAVDDGLSSNGTWLDDRRLSGRVLLRDGDLLRVGSTVIAFCTADAGGARTAMADDAGAVVKVSPAQKRVLVALCRPMLEGKGAAVPPTNAQLAESLHLSVDSVKTHLRALLSAFGCDEVPQSQKRTSLIERAVRLGVVKHRDLESP